MYPATKLCKAIAIAMCLLLSTISYSQTATVEYFEAGAKPNSDSTALNITFVLAIENPESTDSLSFTIQGEENENLYTAGNTLAYWKSSQPYRVEGNMLYLTIEAGEFSGLSAYTANAMLKSTNGELHVYTRP